MFIYTDRPVHTYYAFVMTCTKYECKGVYITSYSLYTHK